MHQRKDPKDFQGVSQSKIGVLHRQRKETTKRGNTSTRPSHSDHLHARNNNTNSKVKVSAACHRRTIHKSIKIRTTTLELSTERKSTAGLRIFYCAKIFTLYLDTFHRSSPTHSVYQNRKHWASSWDYGTYRTGDQRMLRRACASAQSGQSLRCSHTWSMEKDEGSDEKSDF